MRFSVAFQTDKLLADYGTLARRVEELGFDVVSVYNDLYFQPAWLPLLEMAKATHRIQLGPAAVNPFTCHPVVIAGNIALLDEASDGRAYLGIARGSWLEALGIRPRRPVAAMREAIQAIRSLLAGDGGGLQGDHYPLPQGAGLRWRPRRPRLPILLGSWGEKTITACLPWVDQVKIGGTANPRVVAAKRKLLDASTELVVGSVCVVDRDRSRARALARREVALYLPVVSKLDPTIQADPQLLTRLENSSTLELDSLGRLIPDDLLDRVALSGTPKDIVESCLQMIEAGAGRIEFGTPHGLEPLQGIRLLGEEVVPELRRERPVV